MELSFPFLFLSALLFSSLVEAKLTLFPFHTLPPCHPGEPEIENEPHYMQIGFNHLEQMTQKVAGKCNFEFPLDVS